MQRYGKVPDGPLHIPRQYSTENTRVNRVGHLSQCELGTHWEHWHPRWHVRGSFSGTRACDSASLGMVPVPLQFACHWFPPPIRLYKLAL